MKECPACRRCFPDEINHCPQDGNEAVQSISGEPVLDGRYQLERRVGQGGMGVVFQARHIFLKTAHAIKIILPDLVGNDPNLITRFRQEALAAAAIRHQNIIAVTDFGVVRGTMPFLVMEFVKGISLHDILITDKCLSPDRALEIMSAVCGGVGAAHRQNIVHRDLKPLNIMMQDGLPIAQGLKILDFGLAKIKSGDLLGSFVQAKTSGLMGSPFYMAPEQWSDEEPDARADIYSLGVILYQMLGGDVPFKGTSIPAIMKKHLTDPPPPLETLGAHVPPQIEAVVIRALQKDPARRPQTVEAFINELRDAVGSTSSSSFEDAPTATLSTAPLNPQIAGNSTIASPSLLRTKLTIHSEPPGSRVFLNNVSLATTDESGELSIDDVQPGTHSIRVVKEGFTEWERKVECKGGELRVDARLQSLSAPEEFQSTDPFAGTVVGHTAEMATGERQQQATQEQIEARENYKTEGMERHSVDSTRAFPQAATTYANGAARTESMGEGSLAERQGQAPPSLQGHPVSSKPRAVGAPSRKSLRLVALISSLVVVAGVAAYFIVMPMPPPPSPSLTSTTTNDSPTSGPKKAAVVAIPGGTFLMGRNGGPPQEAPAHLVKVDDFGLDKTEVTNAEYADFVHETNYSAPTHWAGGKPLAGQEQWPVVNVSSGDAKRFAEWRSKRDGQVYRLPTEQEWEYAARGGDEDKLYPWGNSWADNRAATKDSGALTPQPVGSYPLGKTRWGALDMIGNVWEWTSTNASFYPGNTKMEIPPGQKDWVIARGGSFLAESTGAKAITATYRDWFPPSTRNQYIGFRLVRSAS